MTKRLSLIIAGLAVFVSLTMLAPPFTEVVAQVGTAVKNGFNACSGVNCDNILDIGGTIRIAGVNRTSALATAPGAVAAGYMVARGSTALDGSNPTTVTTGLTTVVACTATLLRNTALSSGTAFVTHDTPTGGSVPFLAWVVAGTASTGTETFSWVCIGT